MVPLKGSTFFLRLTSCSETRYVDDPAAQRFPDRPPALADPGFDERYERDYNIFNPVNKYAPGNPLNPAQTYAPAEENRDILLFRQCLMVTCVIL
jgi:hypothetical protein